MKQAYRPEPLHRRPPAWIAARAGDSTAARPMVYHIVLLLLLASLFGGASLMSVQTEGVIGLVKKLRHPLVAGSFAVLLSMATFRFDSWRLPRKLIAPFWIWLLFAYTVLLTSAIKGEPDLFADGLWFLVGIPLFFFIVLPTLLTEHANLLIGGALFVGHAPYILASLWVQPLGSYLANRAQSYRGVFFHFNGLGSTSMILAAGACILLHIVLMDRKRKHYLLVVGLILVLIGCLGLILLSSSRTSLLALLLMLLIVLWRSAIDIARMLSLAAAGLVVLVIVLALLGDRAADIWAGIYDKTVNSVESGQLLSGREEIWQEAIEHATLLGYDANYFGSGLTAHNSFIHILALYGSVATLVMMLFACTSLWYAYRYTRVYADAPSAITPLIIAVCFWSMSLAEGVFGSLGRGITMAFLASLGIVIAHLGHDWEHRPGKLYQPFAMRKRVS